MVFYYLVGFVFGYFIFGVIKNRLNKYINSDNYVNILGNNTTVVSINDKIYTGKNIKISNGNVIIDGTIQHDRYDNSFSKNHHYTVTVTANNIDLIVTVGNVTVHGYCGDVNTTSHVTVHGSCGDVNTTGNVTVSKH